MYCKAKLFVLVGVLVVLLNGCATGLNYNQTAPNAENYHPKSTLILPLRLPEGLDQEEEKIGGILTDALANSKTFGEIIDPTTARNQLAAKENKVLADAVTNYISKLIVTGVSDPQLIKTIGMEYHCDTIIVAELSRYGYMNYGGQQYGEVGFSIKVINVDTGKIYWKAGHTDQEPTVFFIKPNLETMTRKLMHKVLSYGPNAPKNKYAGYPEPGR